jgi:pimeloyl-ACP methyl ester carboxylesterase
MFAERGWDATFWSEPWRKDPSVAISWPAYLASLTEMLADSGLGTVTLVAHSFGVHPTVAAIAASGCEVRRLVLISPSFDMAVRSQAIVRLAAVSLAISNPDVVQEMLSAAAQSRSLFDLAVQRALGLAATDATLFSRYWHNQEAFAAYAKAGESPGAGFDQNGFMTLMSDLDARGWLLPDAPPDCDIVAVLGAQDPIDDVAHTGDALRRWAPQARMHVFDACGHWAHLEHPGRICALLAA